MQALLTVRTTAGVGGDQCLKEAALLRELAQIILDISDPRHEAADLVLRAQGMATEWTRLGTICKEREAQVQVDTDL